MSKNTKTAEVQFNESQVSDKDLKVLAAIQTTGMNLSQRIRALSEAGLSKGDIVRALKEHGFKTKNGTDIRFQHVRNVLITTPKKAA